MQRIFGALAVFGGWLCIPLGGVIVLVATEFMGLNHTEGPLPANGLYGVPSIVVLWVLVGASILALVPVGAAMLAPDPSRRLYAAAAVMAAIAVLLLPDELGRAMDLAILPGAGLFAAGGWWLHQAGEIGAPAVEAEDGEPEMPEPETPSVPGAAIVPAAPVQATTASSAERAGLADAPVGPVGPAPAPEPTAGNASTGKAPARGSKSRKLASEPTVECPWCSAPTVVGAERCPSCGASLVPLVSANADPIPGVTAVEPGLRDYAERAAHKKKRRGLLSLMMDDSSDRLFSAPAADVDRAVIGPPSAEVRAEMERLDREIAAGRLPGDNPLPPPETGPTEAGAIETAPAEAAPAEAAPAEAAPAEAAPAEAAPAEAAPAEAAPAEAAPAEAAPAEAAPAEAAPAEAAPAEAAVQDAAPPPDPGA